jgi:hypothetical protein
MSMSLAPLLAITAAFAIWPVMGRVKIERLPMLSIIGAVVATPVWTLTAMYASCSIAHDCP